MLLKHFSFDVEYIPGKKNQLPDALSRLPGNEVFREDPEEADAFLPPTQAEPEEENFVAVLGAADLQQRIVDSQGVEPELHDDHLRARALSLRKAQELRQADGAFALYEPGSPPRLYVPRSMRGEVLRYHHEDTLAGHPGSADTARSIQELLYNRTSEATFGGTCVLAAIAQPPRENDLSTQGDRVHGSPTRYGTAWQSI
jgi:hypothetical protein